MNQIRRGCAGAIALFAVLCFGLGSQSIQAQTADPIKPAEAPTSQEPADVQQLKDRVKQLEQTVDELKKLIVSVETTQKQQQPQVLVSDNSGGVKTINAVLRTTPGDPTAPRSVVKKDDEKGERSMDIYGFAMLDTGYSFKTNHPDWFDTLRPTKLPGFEGEFAPNGKWYMGVRQSRFGVKTSTPTKWGELKTIFEFELFGTGVDAGQTTFRLRHAYGELGHFGAGQYWTVFGDVDAFPNTFEYWGPNGLVWFRNVQVRWMPFKGGKNELTLALERPGASGDQGIYAGRIELAGVRPHLQLPDFTGNVRFNRGWGHIQASWLLGSIKWEDTNDKDDFDFSGSDVRAGLSLTSVLNFNKDNIGRFQATYGQGTQNYMNDAPLDVGAKFNPDFILAPTPTKREEGTTPTSTIAPIIGRAIPMFAMSAFLDHTWSKKFTTAVGYSMLNMENTNAQAPGAFRRGQYFVANLLWYPVENFVMGGEYQWGRRNNFHDTFSSDDSRIQFSFKYSFNKGFKW